MSAWSESAGRIGELVMVRSLMVCVLLMTLGIAGALGAQEGGASLVRARQLRQVSHQPEQALPLYRSLAEDQSAATGDRSEAALGEVRCLLKLGRVDEARDAAGKLPALIGVADLAPKLAALLAS